MVGFPIYNDEDNHDPEKIYLSDLVVHNLTYFKYGFWLAVLTSPSIAFAVEPTQEGGLVPGTAPSPIDPSGGGGYVPTTVRDAIQGIVAVAGCGAAAKTCGDAVTQAVNASADKLGTVVPPSIWVVGGCMFLAGYCAGKLTTKGIDYALGLE